MLKRLLGLTLVVLSLSSCGDDDEMPEPMAPEAKESPVIFDFDSVPYQKLSAYNFYEGNMADLQPVMGVLPYDVITPLFSDYAHKKRFVWMPDSVQASYDGDHDVLAFQDGAVLIKNFYYDHVQPNDVTRIVETRIEYRSNGAWFFAEYVWNDEQTEAFLDMDGSYTDITWRNDNDELQTVNYRVPSEAECITCHKRNEVAIPIGPKPQNMNSDYVYEDGVRNQLVKWEEMGYLAGEYPVNIVTTVPWDDPSQNLSERVRSYLDMNCAHCHRDESHCDYRPMRFAYDESIDPVNLGTCVPPQEFIDPSLTYIIAKGNPARSMMVYRLNATAESERMPLLGRTVVHTEGVALIVEYINSLSPPC